MIHNHSSRSFLFVCAFYLLVGICKLSAQTNYQTDFSKFLNDFRQNFAYLEERKIDLEKIRAFYEADLQKVKTNREFVTFLERVLTEFYNGHISLNTNTASSNRIIPSGADIFAERSQNRYLISDLRKDAAAELSGLEKGMEIIAFNDEPVDKALQEFLPKTADSLTEAMYSYALNMLLAGSRDRERKITVIHNGKEQDFYPDRNKTELSKSLLAVKQLKDQISYIKINNTLGNYDLIPKFDAALDSLLDAKTIILDLTDTPGGGNTTVARALMGRFIEKEQPYQMHMYIEKPIGTVRKWIELVSPRGKVYKGNLIVLVGHWTGSMGEGIAIGFDAMQRAKIVGTQMAGLIGAIYTFEMPMTGIRYSVPAEKMYHIKGTPRENFIPEYHTKNSEETFTKALELAKEYP
ncbi:S41 family peptidase [Flavobacteriaceae bacterium M23B6Z8]